MGWIGDRLPGLMGHVAPTRRVFQVAEQRDQTHPASASLGLCDLGQVTQPLSLVFFCRRGTLRLRGRVIVLTV